MKTITKQRAKAISKLCLPLGLALLASATLAASAQAIEITPDNTHVEATTDAATNPTLTIAGAEVVCEESTLAGTTGVRQPNIDLHPTFQTNCTVFGFIGATVTCVGTMTLEFTTTTGGTIDLDPDFECTITASSCHIVITGPQDPTGGFMLTPTTGIELDVDVLADVSQTCFGGPPTGVQPANIRATYTIDTAGVTIDP